MAIMADLASPTLLKLKRSKRVGESHGCSIYEKTGQAFDLSGDFSVAMEACRSAEKLADAIGMLTALAGAKDRTAGFEKAVYVIQVADDPICKIGVSANPLKRVEDLQGSHYRELFLYAVVFCPTRHAVAIEQAALARASEAGDRLMGEWVSMTPEDTLRMIFEVARDDNRAICDGRIWFDNMVQRTVRMHQQSKRIAATMNRFSNRRVA